MNKIFVSKRLLLPKIALYIYLVVAMLFLVLTPISDVTKVSDGQDNKIGFALFIGIPLIVVFYIFRNYTIKIDENDVTVYLPFNIKWKTFFLNEITHYQLINIDDYEDGSPTRYKILILFKFEKPILKIKSYSYWNANELFENLIQNLNSDVVKLKDKKK